LEKGSSRIAMSTRRATAGGDVQRRAHVLAAATRIVAGQPAENLQVLGAHGLGGIRHGLQEERDPCRHRKIAEHLNDPHPDGR